MLKLMFIDIRCDLHYSSFSLVIRHFRLIVYWVELLQKSSYGDKAFFIYIRSLIEVNCLAVYG
jgi:hypothetical protein